MRSLLPLAFHIPTTLTRITSRVFCSRHTLRHGDVFPMHRRARIFLVLVFPSHPSLGLDPSGLSCIRIAQAGCPPLSACAKLAHRPAIPSVVTPLYQLFLLAWQHCGRMRPLHANVLTRNLTPPTPAHSQFILTQRSPARLRPMPRHPRPRRSPPPPPTPCRSLPTFRTHRGGLIAPPCFPSSSVQTDPRSTSSS